MTTEQLDSKWLSVLPELFRKKVEGRYNLQKIIVNVIWLFFDKILRMGVGLMVSVLVARYLGPEQFGLLNFACAFAAIFGAFASLGLDGIVVRDIVRDSARQYEILSSTFILKLLGGIVAFLVTLKTIHLIRPDAGQTYWLVGIVAVGMIFQSFDVVDLWFQSQVRSKYTVIAKNSVFVVVALVRVVLIHYKAPLIAFAWASLAEIIASSLVLTMFYVRQQANIFVWCPRVNTALRLIRESWPLILSSLAVAIYMRIDQIMLAQMIDNKEVGIYSAALRFSEIWYFIPTVIVSSVMPSLIQGKVESEETYLKRLQQLFSWLVRIAYLIALPMTFLSSQLVTFFYGTDYIGAGNILAIHIWTAVFVFMGVGSTPWTINESTMKYSLFQTITGTLINIGLNFILIPLYGGVGAAIATLIAQIFASFVINAFIPKLRVLFMIELRAMVNPLR